MAKEYKLSYTASEIDAKLSEIENLAKKSEIPSATSELTNDSGFATELYVKEYAQPVGDYALTSEIPSIDGLASEEYVAEQVDVLVDATLSIEGKAADAKAVGDAISNLSSQNANGLTTAQISALDGMFKVCAFIKDDVSAEYNAFKTAFGIVEEEEPGEPEPGEKIDPVYALASPLTTDGASMLDTGYALADKDKNWTIVCDLTGKPGYQVPAWGFGKHIGMWSRSAWQWYCGFNGYTYTESPESLKIATGNLTNFKTVLIHNKGEETITIYYVSSSALATIIASNRTYSSIVGATDTVTLGGATDQDGDKFWAANNTINDFKIYERVLTEEEIKAYLGVS